MTTINCFLNCLVLQKEARSTRGCRGLQAGQLGNQAFKNGEDCQNLTYTSQSSKNIARTAKNCTELLALRPVTLGELHRSPRAGCLQGLWQEGACWGFQELAVSRDRDRKKVGWASRSWLSSGPGAGRSLPGLPGAGRLKCQGQEEAWLGF